MGDKMILLAADHNGVSLKGHLYRYLKDLGYKCIDLGPPTDNEKVDYSDFAFQLARIVNQGDVPVGILICGTGVGMSIAANRFPNVRAALIHNLESALKSREHNDANILCLGAWSTPPAVAEEIVETWLATPFGEGRHVRRVEKITYHNRTNIVAANGVFDMLHKGHVELLKFAKSLGDKLVVGINSDSSVRRLKGANRPVNNEDDRRKVLEAIAEVDEVIIFDEDRPTEFIKRVSPNIVVKGGEWTAEEVRKNDCIPHEIEIKIFPLVENYSTTKMMQKIHEGGTWTKMPSE